MDPTRSGRYQWPAPKWYFPTIWLGCTGCFSWVRSALAERSTLNGENKLKQKKINCERVNSGRFFCSLDAGWHALRNRGHHNIACGFRSVYSATIDVVYDRSLAFLFHVHVLDTIEITLKVWNMPIIYDVVQRLKFKGMPHRMVRFYAHCAVVEVICLLLVGLGYWLGLTQGTTT